MKEFTRKKKVIVINKMLKLLKVKIGHLQYHLCSKYNEVNNHFGDSGGASMDNMRIEFPELYKEIQKRQQRRKSMFAWKPGNRKIRIKFLKEFKQQFETRRSK